METVNEVLRYGQILVDISTPYSNERIYCILLKGSYYEIKKQNGEVVHFKHNKRKPKHLDDWINLSYNKYCNKVYHT